MKNKKENKVEEIKQQNDKIKIQILKDFKDIGFDFKANQEYVLDKKKYLDYMMLKEITNWIKILEK